MRRPTTLAEVAAWSQSADEFTLNLKDFLHEFQAHPTIDSLRDEPASLVQVVDLGHVADAYLAATAAYLSQKLQQPSPRWTREPSRFCEHPWFASPGPHLRACLLLESPGPFRERNLFITGNALEVA